MEQPGGGAATNDDDAGRSTRDIAIEFARAHGLLTLALVAVGVTLVGVFSTWTSGDAGSLNGVQGPQNGWFAIVYALLGAGVAHALARRSWPGILATLVAALVILITVVGNRGIPEFSNGWGYWLTFIGGSLLAIAGVTALVWRLREREDPLFRSSIRSPRPWLAGFGIFLSVVVFVALFQVFFLVEDQSWPPPPDAITAEGAQAATEDFVAGNPRPHDVGLDYAWTTAATITPWAEGVNFFPRIVADIERATSSVHILMYGWNKTEVGQEMADLVKSKVAEGVEVRILVDSYGSGPTARHKELFSGMEAAGAEIVVNDVLPLDRDSSLPDRYLDWRQDEVGRTDHRKLYVIDGVVAWTGGAGIESHFLNGKFHDVMVRVTGDVVRQAQAVFLTSFRSHDADLPDDLSPYFPQQPEAGSIRTALLQVVPGGFVSATQSAREMIDDAERRLDIMSPYFTDTDMIQRTINAAERGVKVRVVVSEKSNNDLATDVLRHHYNDLLDAGVEVWELPGTVVHAKLIVADDWVHFGTLNLDAWALYRNFEIAMVAQSPEAAALFEKRVFGPDIARSKPGVPPSGFTDKLSGWFWDKMAYFL